MLETLYKTKTPEASLEQGEYYTLSLHQKPVNHQLSYFVVEMHGWWDEGTKKPLSNYTTFSPEEGYATWEEAYERYKLQRQTRAKDGFVHCFKPDYTGVKKHEYEEIPVGHPPPCSLSD